MAASRGNGFFCLIARPMQPLFPESLLMRPLEIALRCACRNDLSETWSRTRMHVGFLAPAKGFITEERRQSNCVGGQFASAERIAGTFMGPMSCGALALAMSVAVRGRSVPGATGSGAVCRSEENNAASWMETARNRRRSGIRSLTEEGRRLRRRGCVVQAADDPGSPAIFGRVRW